MNLVTSKNKITHVVRVMPNSPSGGHYRYKHYAIAICGTIVGHRLKNIRGRKCKKCGKLTKF